MVGGHLPVFFGVPYQFNGGISGRHGDRTVKWSTLFPRFNQVVGVLVVDTPHLELDAYGIVK